MRRRFSALLAAAAVLAACSSPADGIGFRAPKGWSSTPGMLGRFQLWMTGSDPNRQILGLIRGDATMTVRDFSSKFDLGDGSDDVSVAHTRIPICNGTIADDYRGASASALGGAKRSTVFELVIGPAIGKSRYAAVYVRPRGTAPDPQAETAIRSLCPRV